MRRWMLMASVATAALATTSTARASDARVGIFVGSNGAPSGRSPLLHAEADAARMRDAFVELGGIEPRAAHLIRGPDAEQILAMIERAGRGAKMLVFYYSGHADERALLLEGSQLSFADLTEALEATGAQLNLHIVDACRSGALTRKGASLGDRLQLAAEEYGEGKVVITSSAEWEDSLESDRLGGSFFTLHMATGLRGAADADADGRVTLDEAYRYVYGRTVQSTLASGGGVQHPTFRYDLSGRGDLTLTWPNRARGVLRFRDGDYAVTEAVTGRLVAEVATPGAAIGLAPGRYHVVRRARDALFSGHVEIAAGSDVRAEDILEERTTYARLVRKGRPDGPVLSHALRMQVGLRGRIASGLEAAPMFRVGYELVLPWLSVMPYVGVTTSVGFDTPRLSYRTNELGLGMLVSRAIDFSYVTLRGGLGAELVRLAQSEAEGREPDRRSWGPAFVAHVAVESAPIADVVTFALVTEASLYAYASSEATVAPDVEEGAIVTRPTYRALLALGYHF
ncbi:MAG: caspase family protein [Deltaproteobacteria bacterium]